MAQSLASFCRFLFVVMLPKNLALAMGQCCPALFWGWMGKPGAVGEPGVSTGLNMVEEVQQNAKEASTDSDRSNHSSVDSFMHETVHEDHRRQSEMRSDVASDASAMSLIDDDSSVQVSCYSLAGNLLHTVIVSPDASIGQLKSRLRKSSNPMWDVEPTSFIIEDVKFDWAHDYKKFMLTARCRGNKKLPLNFVWEAQGTS